MKYFGPLVTGKEEEWFQEEMQHEVADALDSQCAFHIELADLSDSLLSKCIQETNLRHCQLWSIDIEIRHLN